MIEATLSWTTLWIIEEMIAIVGIAIFFVFKTRIVKSKDMNDALSEYAIIIGLPIKRGTKVDLRTHITVVGNTPITIAENKITMLDKPTRTNGK